MSSEIRKIYPREYEAYKQKSSIVSRIKNLRYLRVLRPLLTPYKESVNVLDYGCGSGDFLTSIAQHIEGNLVGFDINPPESKSEKIVFLDDAKSLNALKPFDLIFSFQVIEHLSDPLAFLHEIRSLLSKNGRVIIETPSTSGLLFSKVVREKWGGWHAPRHFVLFNRETIQDLCVNAGFVIEDFKYIPSPFQWIETIRPFIPKNSRLQRLLSLDNFLLVALVYTFDFILIKGGRKSSNMKVLLRRFEP